jgi:hypothetical protein
VPGANGVDDYPVNLLVSVHGNISEAHGFSQSSRQSFGNLSGSCQLHKCVSHGLRRREVLAGKNMGCQIHAQLYGTGQVQDEDVLKVDVGDQRLNRLWTFF